MFKCTTTPSPRILLCALFTEPDSATEVNRPWALPGNSEPCITYSTNDLCTKQFIHRKLVIPHPAGGLTEVTTTYWPKACFASLTLGKQSCVTADSLWISPTPTPNITYNTYLLALNIYTVVRLLMLPASAATPAFILAYSNCSGFGSFQMRLQNCEKWLLASSCTPTRREQLGSHWTDLHEISLSQYFSKICRENSTFIKIWQE